MVPFGDDPGDECVSEKLTGDALARARAFLEAHARGWCEQTDAGRIPFKAGLAPPPAPADDEEPESAPPAKPAKASKPRADYTLWSRIGLDGEWTQIARGTIEQMEERKRTEPRSPRGGALEIRSRSGTPQSYAGWPSERARKKASAPKAKSPKERDKVNGAEPPSVEASAGRGAPPAGPPGPLLINVAAADHATANPPGVWTRTSIPLDRGTLETMHSAPLAGDELEAVRSALWAAAVLWDECTPGEGGACVRWVYPDGRQRLEDPDELVRSAKGRHAVIGHERGCAGLWELIYQGDDDAAAARAYRAAAKRGPARQFLELLEVATTEKPAKASRKPKSAPAAQEAQAAHG